MTSEAGAGQAKALPARARLVDVAKRAGVTKSVVSRILNDDTTLRIRPETRERVLAVAAELGYRPNVTARALSVSRTRAFALLIPDLSNSVYAAVTRGAFRRARDHGYVLLIAEDAAGDDDAAYAELVTAGRVDGLLVASSRPEHPWSSASSPIAVGWRTSFSTGRSRGPTVTSAWICRGRAPWSSTTFMTGGIGISEW